MRLDPAWVRLTVASMTATRTPARRIAARGALDLAHPFNSTTTNDITDGNPGSPVINRDAEVVGLIFDGDVQSTGGDFGFARNKTPPLR